MDSRLLHELKVLLGPDGVLHQPEDLLLYEYDGSVEVARPDCVVFPRNTEDVVTIVKLANEYETALVGRGAGTGLSGGALARQGGIDHRFFADESHSGSRRGKPTRHGAAGRGES